MSLITIFSARTETVWETVSLGLENLDCYFEPANKVATRCTGHVMTEISSSATRSLDQIDGKVVTTKYK